MIWRIVAALALVMAIVLAYRHRDLLDPVQWTTWVEGWGTAGMALFVLLYILATVLFLPGSVLTLAGGALFGPWLGGVLCLVGATTGAGLSFLIARHLAGDWVARRAGGMMGRLLAGVEAEGWRFVAFVRLVPIFPFNLLNYALGLTRIRLDHYLLASLVCMAPGGLAYAWLGYAGKEAASGSADAVR
ncbi:MAG: TVP38/TMEM64 family protein, partial [Magnetococcus sp. DMHC-8]